MRQPIKLLLYAVPLLLAAGCDTKEDVFMVGEEPKDILSLDNSPVTFSPEGGTYDIEVTSIASWTAELSGTDQSQFTVTPTSGRGNGTITIKANTNSTQRSPKAELLVRPVNFEMEPYTISISQANTTFSVESYPSSDPTPENGGSSDMTVYSSIAWQLDVIAHDAEGNVGDTEWLTITPGLSGEGKSGNSPLEFRFAWLPNYTERARTIRFQLSPQSSDITIADADMPRPITLTQAAGTRPQNVRCNLDNLDIVNADVTFSYNSIAPMKDCGVTVYKVEGDNATLYNTYKPEGDSYQTVGSYSLKLEELTENTTFRLVPYAENEVGRVEGDPQELTTGIKPENMVYEGVAIVNANSGGVAIETDLTSATVTLVATSDVAPLAKRIASAVMTFDGRSVDGTATAIDEGSWTYVFKTASAGVELTSNKEYDYTITITGGDLPRSQGQVTNNVATVSGKFKTKGRTPGSGDNDKPVIGE